MLPSDYRPQHPPDFIGPARAQAELLQRYLALTMPAGKPAKVLILGRPGIGKSELSNYLCRTLTSHPSHPSHSSHWNITRLNGKQCDTARVEQLAWDLQLTSLMPGYRVIQIEEIDRMTADAQVRFLTVLDDLPKHSAVIGTSNCAVKQFDERFQRRFKVITLTPPKCEIITGLLIKLGVRESDAKMLGVGSGGNVGQALEDADLYLTSQLAA